MKFIIVNGEILKKEEANCTSFFWNDPLLLTNKMWFGFGGIPLFNENTDQIVRQLQDLKCTIPDLFLNKREFFRKIKRMLNKNRFYRSGLVNIQILISATETNFIMFATPFEQTEFVYQEKGTLINFSDILKYSKNPLQFKVEQSIFYELIARAKNNDTHIHHSVFLNEKENVCDTGTANIFFIKKNVLITPSLETGCISDHLRSLILDAAKNIGLQTNEAADITPETVYKMDEIFFAAESTGIHWVLGIDTKRFVHPVSIKIHRELNEILKKKVLN